MRNQTKEHFYPKWLIKMTKASGVRMDGPGQEKWVNPNSFTVPLCAGCNSRLGTELEGPVKAAFDSLQSGLGISDHQAELIVRWLWKFETWAWMKHYGSDNVYNMSATPVERLCGSTFHRVRDRITLSVGRIAGDSYIHANGRDYGLPMGIDTPVTQYDADCVLGVFSKLALGVSMVWADDMLPLGMDRYHFPPLGSVSDRDEKVFFPGERYLTPNEAVDEVLACSDPIKLEHEKQTKEARALLGPGPQLLRPQIILPSWYK